MQKKTTFERLLPALPWVLLWGFAPMPVYIWAIITIIK
jgi:hypothetical protein